ncbi:MAG TPA: VWA domain-containing protein [Thermoanaerobaculaceae bacterium]|nr:VWA domain-containing protein [Thermoanaerobaculaceae bacterium]
MRGATVRRVLLLAIGTLLVGASARAVKVSELPPEWRRWLEEEVYPLITGEQRKAFLELESDAQRTDFAERLWTVWGDTYGLGSAFRRNYLDRLDQCRTDFGNTTEDRARVLLINGPPDGKKEIDCDRVFQPLEFWQWTRIEGLGDNVLIVFYKPYGMGRYKLWDPTIEGRSALYNFGGWSALQSWMSNPQNGMFPFTRPEYECGDPEILRMLDAAEYWLRDIQTREAMQHAPIPPQGRGSAKESASARFLQFSTVVPKGSSPFNFDLTDAIGERRGSKMAVTFTAKIPKAGLETNKVGDVDVVQLDVTGEVSSSGQMADRFRYAFTFPAAGAAEFPVQVERELHPGKYHLRLKVQDGNSKHAAVREIDFEVPMPELQPLGPADAKADATLAKVAAGREAALLLQGPEGEEVMGVQRFSALVGPKVARVEFYLDGRPVLTKNRPPYEVELDLGPLPRLASVLAVALDATGHELDRKQIDLNVGRERFFVRLQPVGSGDRKGGKVRAAVAVNVPPERKLTKLELYWNEGLVATLFQPPFDVWLPVKDDGSIGYLRALAVLEDGSQAEDVQFVNAPQFLTGITVHTVELPVTVLDSGGKPVDGLKQADFDVEEDGVKQSISHFALQKELPIRMGLVLDTSGSMEKTLPDVQRVVIGFLRNLLQPRDRAFVLSFSERPNLIEGFTADFNALERALIGLKADGETALYDATVYALFQFSGLRGRKSMVILTDGEDNASQMDYDKALDYAKRSGATIYTIGIDLPITKVGIRSQLSRLARTTGGDAFFLARGVALQPVYDRINRELRSQYLLAYTSTSELPADTFRKITVKVSRPKVEVRTISGYYPGG